METMKFLQTSKKSITQLLGPNHRSPLIDLGDYVNINWKSKAGSTVGSANPFPLRVRTPMDSLWTCVGAQQPESLGLANPTEAGMGGSWRAKALTSPTHQFCCRTGCGEGRFWQVLSAFIHCSDLNLKGPWQAHRLKA